MGSKSTDGWLCLICRNWWDMRDRARCPCGAHPSLSEYAPPPNRRSSQPLR